VSSLPPGDLDRLWAAFDALAELDHVHLDELIDDAPRPGSSDWVGVLLTIVDRLAVGAGMWFVRLPVGYADGLPKLAGLTVAGAIEDAAMFVPADGDRGLYFVGEPPSVYRGAAGARPASWQGVAHSRIRVLSPNVRERISYALSDDAGPNEPYTVSVVWEISGKP
jgi:hypothetical protein